MDAERAKSTAKKWAIGVVLAAVGGAGIYTFATLTFTYSAGERVGYVQKISRRGWLCKTWEGELAMVQVPGQPTATFEFTAKDESTAQAIEALAGHKVALEYEQHRGVPSTCFGDTEYFVVGVQKAD